MLRRRRRLRRSADGLQRRLAKRTYRRADGKVVFLPKPMDPMRELKNLAREVVFLRDRSRCVVSGQGYGACSGVLQWSHIKPQGSHPGMRFMPVNALTMCKRHHLYWWHKDPTEAGHWFRTRYPERAEEIRLLAATPQRVDLELTRLWLERERAKLEAQHNGGSHDRSKDQDETGAAPDA